ncbi:MAG: GTPase HflX [Alphaproteobacteria bacterium]|nr:GTPase HflX [Alphaproteobacteria bacterium]
MAVLHVDFKGKESLLRSADEKLAEAVNLFEALEVEVVYSDIVRLSQVNSHTLLGKGKVEVFAGTCRDLKLDAVFVDCDLTPSQQRNLEKAWQVKVLDRTAVILEIFASRAQTKAGRLQVSLAQIAYQQSRLVRSWTHLERQRGGLSKVGGPGERQIELDRRMLLDKAKVLREKLAQVKQERGVQRSARTKQHILQIALVGYTNAGKSTLFEALTGHEAGSENKLFATLDPLVRKLKLLSGREVVLSDTVGFISDLPHELVEAFKATLEEVVASDLILQVHDASSLECMAQADDVAAVLKQIGACSIPIIHVVNKVDVIECRDDITLEGIYCSALTGEGLEELQQRIEEHFAHVEVVHELEISAAEGKKIAWLHSHGKVVEQSLKEQTWHLKVQLESSVWQKYQKLFDVG